MEQTNKNKNKHTYKQKQKQTNKQTKAKTNKQTNKQKQTKTNKPPTRFVYQRGGHSMEKHSKNRDASDQASENMAIFFWRHEPIGAGHGPCAWDHKTPTHPHGECHGQKPLANSH